MLDINSLIPKTLISRQIESEIQKFIEDREIIVIRGPRQSGKTTLMLKLAQEIQNRNGNQSVVFVSFEDEIARQRFEADPKGFIDFYRHKDKTTYFFFDEVQYVNNAGQTLKLIYDLYPQEKLIVSGSSTLDLSKLGEYLVGRALFFELLPLNFSEFLNLKDTRLHAEYQKQRFSFANPAEANSIFLTDLNSLLTEYLTFGGYPRLSLEPDKEKKLTLLSNLFSTYIEKDIVKLYGLKYKDKAIVVLKYLAEIVGSVINYHDLCQTASLSFAEAKEILCIFEDTYVIAPVAPFHRNLITELKKNPKYYFRDLGFRNLLTNRFDFSQAEKGQLAENYVYTILSNQKPNYWRTTAKAEVDFVIKDGTIPIEVKLTPKIERSYLSFIDTYQPGFGLIASTNPAPATTRYHTKIFTIPLSLL